MLSAINSSGCRFYEYPRHFGFRAVPLENKLFDRRAKMAESKAKNSNSFLTYKGRPLVRCGDTLYFGNMWEKYVVVMQIINHKKLFDKEIAGTVSVQLVSTNNELSATERVIKQAEKDGLYNAIDIGSIWLDRALSN
jgi:hypothetical protein